MIRAPQQRVNRDLQTAAARRFHLLPLALVVALLLAPSLVIAAESSTVTIAWDPAADASVVGYIVYVGTQSGTYTDQFDAGNSTSFDYVSAQNGRRYFFAVKSYNDAHVLSVPSNEASTVVGEPVSGSSPNRQRWPDPNQSADDASTGTAGDSNAVRRPAVVQAMAGAGDEGVLFVEGRRVVRTLINGAVSTDPLLAVGGSAELAGLAVDPSFASSRLVFVGGVEISPDGAREFSIMRYRLVGHTLGERAVIVTGLNLPPVGDVAFNVDGVGHLIVAVPASTDGSRDPYAGKVLRFNTDGTVPSDNPTASPIVAYGYGAPTALQVDRTGRMWLAGQGAPWPQPLAVLDLKAVSAQWPAVPQGVAVGTGATAVVSALDIVPGPTTNDPSRLMMLVGDRLAAAQLNGNGVSAPVTWSLAAHGSPTGLHATDVNSVLVAFVGAQGDLRVNDESSIARFQVP